MMTPRIPNPAKIAEVDSFGQDMETPHHDGVQRWCHLAPTQPFGRPHERKKSERWRRVAHQIAEESTRVSWDCVAHLSSWGPPLYSGEGVPLPLHQGTPRPVAKGRRRAVARVWVGPSQPPPTTKTLAPSWRGPRPLALGPWCPSPYPIRGHPRV
jgi:hypothetical protein